MRVTAQELNLVKIGVLKYDYWFMRSMGIVGAPDAGGLGQTDHWPTEPMAG
jgi:hypothetical protein